MAYPKKYDDIDTLSVNTLRALVLDMIDKANSGHPGMALDIAPTLYVLYRDYLTANPKQTDWFNRDRFILSSGHNSALLYALLHLAGFSLSIDDLKRFRQLGSLTPGHPEVKYTPGIEATAGPLGQGIAQSVGFALAEEAVASQYKEGERLCSHYTFVLCGDGCLEEGISQEAISFAGLQKLEKLILIYDQNQSTLDGPTSWSLNEDEKKRFEASGWRTLEVKDGNNLIEISKAIKKAKKPCGKPTMILVHTEIGYGSPLAGSHKSHGSPLGEAMSKETKDFFNYSLSPFEIDPRVYDRFKETFCARGKKAYKKYDRDLKNYQKQYPDEYHRFLIALKGDLKDYLLEEPHEFKNEASRATSGRFLVNANQKIPFLMGGSADVASSTKTSIPLDPGFSPAHHEARNINFGIREFGMASIQNGMLLHGGLRTYVGSFFVFIDYMRAAIRMSSLEKLPAIYVLTHDSLAVGEDGPTHEPIEQLESLRAQPHLVVLRPADARETYASWNYALASLDTPTCLILSRQTLPLISSSSKEGVNHGAYLVEKCDEPALEVLASGSEVNLAVETSRKLKKEGINISVISVPSFEILEKQPESYKKCLFSLPREKRVGLEMGTATSYYKYCDYVYGLHDFGVSAPCEQALAHYGFNVESFANYLRSLLK